MEDNKKVAPVFKADKIIAMYPSDFTKKQAEAQGKSFVEQLFSEGLHDEKRVFAQVSRFKAVVNSIESEIRKRIVINKGDSELGVSFDNKNGSKQYAYNEDPEVQRLNKEIEDITFQVQQRQELVKVATDSKNQVYDGDGAQVMPVSITYTKSSITVSF